jgi:hypothetical protein
MRLVLEFTLLLLPARDDQSQPAHSCPVSTLALLQGTIAEPNTFTVPRLHILGKLLVAGTAMHAILP